MPGSVGLPLDEQEERRERARRVSLALRELSEEAATLLEEKYVEGRSLRELAARRGSSEKAAESALARARAAFRSAFARLEAREESLR